MNTFPIIRLEIEGIKQSIIHAFSELDIQKDQYVRESLERFCHPDNIKRIVDDAVRTAVTDAMREEVDQFFRYGDGHEIIRNEIRKKLKIT